MNKNGFVFVETIVAIVILTSSLLILYSTFNNVLQMEKIRINYDDVNYIYRTHYLKDKINELNIMAPLREITTNNNTYFVTIGPEYQNLFLGHETEKYFLNKMLEDFEVSQMIILKENKLDNLKSCTLECSLDKNCYEYENCNNLYMNLSDEMISYLKTIYIDIPATYVLVVEYNTCNKDNTNCENYYSWVSV